MKNSAGRASKLTKFEVTKAIRIPA